MNFLQIGRSGARFLHEHTNGNHSLNCELCHQYYPVSVLAYEATRILTSVTITHHSLVWHLLNEHSTMCSAKNAM